MEYKAKDFSKILGTKGFSDNLLQMHFKLYQGYVNNTNKVAETLLNAVKENKTGTLEFAELKRRFGWEFNGMRLHELYFENISKEKKKLDNKSLLLKKMKESFGAEENCHKDFMSTGALRGIGWTILYYDQEGDRLFNVWINEHDLGHLAGAVPILVMDVFEHAFVLDYGMNRADYINSFIEAIDWNIVEARFKATQK